MTKEPSALAEFLSGYLHQDWDLEADDPRELVEEFATTADPAVLAQVDQEIATLLERCDGEDELADQLLALGSYYDPRPAGIAPSEWLASVRTRIANGPPAGSAD